MFAELLNGTFFFNYAISLKTIALVIKVQKSSKQTKKRPEKQSTVWFESSLSQTAFSKQQFTCATRWSKLFIIISIIAAADFVLQGYSFIGYALKTKLIHVKG